MTLLSLFGDYGQEEDDDEADDTQTDPRQLRRGAAGHHLAIADLLFRGYDAADIGGADADIIASIDGRWRSFQVKASAYSNHFGPGGKSKNPGNRSGNRELKSYKGKIDAFAFASLARRLVYYVSIDAIDTRSMTINNFSRQACDMSFDELLRRWNV